MKTRNEIEFVLNVPPVVAFWLLGIFSRQLFQLIQHMSAKSNIKYAISAANQVKPSNNVKPLDLIVA